MILVDKEGANRDYVKIEEDSKKEYASKGVAGTALGLAANEQYLERKECEDAIALTNAIWQ